MKTMLVGACLSVLVGCGVGVEAEADALGSREDAVMVMPPTKGGSGGGGGTTQCQVKNACFGAAGPDCFPAVGNHFGCNGSTCAVSGGSIRHDSCCFASPNGVMCGGNNSSSACQAAWDIAIDREIYGLAWKRVVNTCVASTTGIVNMAAYCAPANAIVRPADASFCCGGSRPFNTGTDMDIFAAQLVNPIALNQPLVVCTGPTPAPTPPTTPVPPGSVQDLPCNPNVGCGADATCSQRTVRGVYGHYCMEY